MDGKKKRKPWFSSHHFGKKLSQFVGYLTPLLINYEQEKLSLTLSQRFLLFQFFTALQSFFEHHPRSFFLSVLRQEKQLGKFLHGKLQDLCAQTKTRAFNQFFHDPQLAHQVAEELHWAKQYNKDLFVTIFPNGLLIYDNYQPKQLNLLLFTIHAGEYLPLSLQKKHVLREKERHAIEDTHTHYLFGPLVLQGAGMWINTKLSRFACDLNRPRERAIYENYSESWIKEVWQTPLNKKEKLWLLRYYDHFYFLLEKIIHTYHFAALLDGHSMRALPGRPNISFGIGYLHPFFLPQITAIKRKFQRLYAPVAFNKPYKGGYLPQWLHTSFPDRFLISMEINKALYMNRDNVTVKKQKQKQLQEDLQKLFSFS